MRNPLLAAGILALSACGPPAPRQASYVKPVVCAGCHAEIAKSYARTGMAQSFFRATGEQMRRENWARGRLDHPLSERSYQYSSREGRYFLRRWQTDGDGREVNAVEREIHYVMGSGNHARSYIHRTAQGRLVEMPVAWYPENGGFFAMSPGYDRPDHQDFRRKISTDCMFCHNAYPAALDMQPAAEPEFAAELPEGIDCQRCHGPGSAHVESGGRRESIVNPARLGRERGMEVCMQCHLETTSFPLPNSLIRFGRGAFSYRPGEPLAQFTLHFDHAPGTGREGKFEIVNSVYRLRQSACFVKSGTMQCTTCHDPHRVPRGVEAETAYDRACRQCHAALARHPAESKCAGCHMPKRRTEDVVHAVMTDHRIMRRAPENPLAPRRERHETPGRGHLGEVAAYYPREPDELHLAVAQVVQRSNLAGGIPRLEAVIARLKPTDPQPYFALAQARAAAGDRSGAIREYRGLLDRHPRFVPALRNLGELLNDAGVLERARDAAPEDPAVLHSLGQCYRDLGRLEEARTVLQRAVERDPDYPEAHNALGCVLIEKGDLAGARRALEEAIRTRPDFADAHSNLGSALLLAGDLPRAGAHHRKSVALAPGSPLAKHSFTALGNLSAANGGWTAAVRYYRQALVLDPALAAAHLGLGEALAASGDRAGARRHLEQALAGGDARVKEAAAESLKSIASPE
ncbi:MAG: tetratricopeptide repeat protein [Acidobacteria bacterium]|nr:tetratricopeptide repeat protein [Acidobacteriota bacterium]